MGNLAGFVAPVVGGHDPGCRYDWNIFLYSMASLYVLGGLCWPLIDPVDAARSCRQRLDRHVETVTQGEASHFPEGRMEGYLLQPTKDLLLQDVE